MSISELSESIVTDQIDASNAVVSDFRRRLAARGYRALQGLNVAFESATLTLHGTLRSYYGKQIALTVAQQTEGVETVVDRIDVSDN